MRFSRPSRRAVTRAQLRDANQFGIHDGSLRPSGSMGAFTHRLLLSSLPRGSPRVSELQEYEPIDAPPVDRSSRKLSSRAPPTVKEDHREAIATQDDAVVKRDR